MKKEKKKKQRFLVLDTLTYNIEGQSYLKHLVMEKVEENMETEKEEKTNSPESTMENKDFYAVLGTLFVVTVCSCNYF